MLELNSKNAPSDAININMVFMLLNHTEIDTFSVFPKQPGSGYFKYFRDVHEALQVCKPVGIFWKRSQKWRAWFITGFDRRHVVERDNRIKTIYDALYENSDNGLFGVFCYKTNDAQLTRSQNEIA